MKKTLAGFLAGMVTCSVLCGIYLLLSVNLLDFTQTISCPDFEYAADVFKTKVPEYSCKHFFFQEGLQDKTMYWSFVLRPDDAGTFLDPYVKKKSLTTVTKTADLPSWIISLNQDKRWRPEMWFNSFGDLSEIYYKEFLFCGYSKEKNRIYLLTWND